MQLDANKYYLIRATNGASVMCWRGDSSPKLVSGGARYNVVNRARRRSTVQWDGDDPYRMDVSILLDGWMRNISVEHDVALLNNMRQSPGDLVPPVQVFVDGALPVKGGTWVMEGIDWGDMVLWSNTSSDRMGEYHGAGYRLRQDAVLHLLQYIQPKILQVSAPNSGVSIVLKAEQTLQNIANDFNTSVNAIIRANGKRDSKAVKTGEHLIIPSSPFNLPIKGTVVGPIGTPGTPGPAGPQGPVK
jgi:hypothetical protein